MVIYFNNTQLDLAVNDNSYRYRAIKGEHSLTLCYSLPKHEEIPLGACCTFEGETYTLESPENFKKHHTRNFEYTLIMESEQAKLKKYKFRDVVYAESTGQYGGSRRLKFSLTAKPKEHLKMLVDNLNKHETGWAAGEDCIDAVEKCISYNHSFCMDALSQIADAFETEWEIIGKTIHLRKVEHNRGNPLPLSYGRGKGFKSGVSRSNSNGSKPVEILYVQGGERNIDASKYGSRELLLPKKQEIGYDGEQFYYSKEEESHLPNVRWYISDEDGFSIHRSDKPLSSQVEDSLDCSHIYPSWIGCVSEVVWIYKGKEYALYSEIPPEADPKEIFCDFFDNIIPGDLDFEACRIGGEKMTVIFQSGMLAGKEFDVEKYVHENEQGIQRRFKLVSQEIDGQTMPNKAFSPKPKDSSYEGDKYAVFGMTMPDTYVKEASMNMFREAVKYFYENEEQKFTFTGELDGIWAKKDWLNIGGKIKLGGYVLFTDDQFQSDGVLIRIVGIKDYINNPHSPQIELSNEIVGNSISSALRKIESNEVLVDDLHKGAVQFTKRRFRDSQETIDMLENALLDRFTHSINPIAVQTMAMLVGDESLQFQFIDETGNKTEHSVDYDNFTKQLMAAKGTLQHLTLGSTVISPNRSLNNHPTWNIPEKPFPPLAGDLETKSFYLYAKVSKMSNAGEFIMSQTAIGMNDDEDYYYLLMGILNSEYEGKRSYVSLYGFSEILPGRITTENIVSADGNTYFDLANSEIGGNIKFSSNGQNIPIQAGIDNSINNIKIGSVNLLQNTGFTGDFQTRQLTAETQLTSETEMFSERLKYWEGNAQVNEDTGSASGYSCHMFTALKQDFFEPVIEGERYVLSFRAKGNVTVKIGTFTAMESVTGNDFERFIYKFEATQATGIEFSGDCVICEIQLERGTVATTWSPSPFDNPASTTGFEVIRYLSDAIKGKTSILGGLILTSMIRLGIFRNGELEKITSGISGLYNDDNDVAFWAGGSLEDAIRAAMQPHEETGAQAVITHGGRAILNDAVIRGLIYADGGVFKGRVEANEGVFHGRVEAEEGYFRGRVESNKNGGRIIIDPVDRSVDLIDTSDKLVGRWGFYNGGSSLSTFFYSAGSIYEIQIHGGNIQFLMRDGNTGAISLSSWMGLSGAKFDLMSFPNANNLSTVSTGELYRDGDTIKIKI